MAGVAQRFQDGVDVVRVAGFDDDVEFGLFERHVMEQPLVIDLDDIAAGLADQALIG